MWYGRRRTLLATVTSSLHSGTDNGQTFSTPDNLSKTPGGSDEPQISSEGNNVYVVWTDVLLALISFTQQTMRTFGLFGSALNLSHNPESGFSQSPQISSSP